MFQRGTNITNLSGVITVSKAGVYMVCAQVFWDSTAAASHYHKGWINYNNSDTIKFAFSGQEISALSTDLGSLFICMMNLNTSDNIRYRIQQSGTSLHGVC